MDCLFCSIVKGDIPSAKVWEDDEFLAFLDAFPNTPGMTLVVPKEHHPSDILELEDEFVQRYFLAAKRTARLLKKALGVKRVALVVEGLGVNHAHFKLYPMHGLEAGRGESKEEAFFETYPGYITTLCGPPVDSEELQKLAAEIRKHN